jgi:hypothetical protein
VQTGVRGWFVRGVVEAIGDAAPGSLASLRARLPERLSIVCGELLAGSASSQAILTLPDAEALIFELDALSGLSPGESLEAAGRAFALRTLATGTLSVDASDLERLGQLGRALVAEFLGGSVTCDVEAPSTDRVVLSLTTFGRPRAARLLRHFAEGAVRALARPGQSGEMPSITALVSGDRATLTVSQSAPPEGDRITPSRRPSSVTLRAPTGLSQQIEAILASRPPAAQPPPEDDD